MAIQVINVGTGANSGGGDALRDAMIKINENFVELYDRTGGDVASSIIGADSTVLVDGPNSSINADALSGTAPAGVVTFPNISNTPTSVAGYGITDAYTKSQTDQKINVAILGLTDGTTDFKGSVFADDSTLLVDGVNGKITGEVTGTISSINWMAASDSYLTISNGGSTGPGPIQIVASANLDLTTGNNSDINMSPHGSGRVKVGSGGLGIVEAATFIGHADETMYLSSKTTGAESTHITLNSTSGVATTMYGAVDFVSGGSVDFTGSTVTGLPAAEINDLTDVDTATAAPSRDTQPLVWDTVDGNWYPGNGISISAIARIETGGMLYFDASSSMVFEGTTANNFETTITASDPSQDNAIVIPDASGTLALTSDIPTALSSFTNDLDYAGIVGGAIQANGLPSGTTFTDTLTLPVLTAEPSSPVNGMVAVADGTSWDPMSNAAQTMVVYLAGAWRQIAQGGV